VISTTSLALLLLILWMACFFPNASMLLTFYSAPAWPGVTPARHLLILRLNFLTQKVSFFLMLLSTAVLPVLFNTSRILSRIFSMLFSKYSSHACSSTASSCSH
jgi:hypothetical protein